MTERKIWRLIACASHDASTNMAIDEAILEARLLGVVPNTLRTYLFAPSAISIGYAQDLSMDMLGCARQRGFDVVRRPTGGRAVLHHGDLTYSFVGSTEDGTLSSSVNTSYRQICSGLQYAMERLGITLQLGSGQGEYKQHQDCFAATTTADLHIDGKKIIGSAQVRRRGALLQHGSILLDQDQSLMPEILGASLPMDSQVKPVRHANLFEAAGRTFSILELEAALSAGFEQAFQVTFNVGPLSDCEQELSARLRQRYQLLASCD